MSLLVRTPVDAAVHGTGAVVVADPLAGAYNQNDLMLLVVQTANEYTSLSTPNGWAEVTACRIGTGTAGASGAVALQVFWKFAAASSNGCTIADAGNHVVAQAYVFDWSGNQSAVEPFGSVSKATYAADALAHNPAHVTRQANEEIFAAFANAASSTLEQNSAESNTSLSTTSNAGFGQTTDGVGGGFDTATGTKVAAGTLAADTWTYVRLNSTAQAVVQLGITTTVAPVQGLNPQLGPSGTTHLTMTSAALALAYSQVSGTLRAPLAAFAPELASLGWFASEQKPLGWFDEDMVSAVASYTLSADAGAFAEAGQNAGRLLTRVFPAAAGSFSEAGQAVAMPVGREVAAAAGSFAETGSASSAPVARVVAAGAGAIAETGQAVAMPISRAFPVDAGSLAEAGSGVAIPVGRVLAAALGSVAVSGADSRAPVGRSLGVDAGSIAEDGADVSFPIARVLLAGAGAIDVLGEDVTIIEEYEIAVDAGDYAATGSSASFVVSRAFVVDAGAVDVVGEDLALPITRLLAAGVGAIAVDGEDSAAPVGRPLVVGAGSAAIAGEDAALPLGRKISAGAGTVYVVGAPSREETSSGGEDEHSHLVGQLGDLVIVGPHGRRTVAGHR